MVCRVRWTVWLRGAILFVSAVGVGGAGETGAGYRSDPSIVPIE